MHDITGDDSPLPRESESVRFVVSGHRGSLLGVYSHERFRSRWGTYGMTEVRACSSVADAQPDPQPRAPAGTRYWSERPMRGG